MDVGSLFDWFNLKDNERVSPEVQRPNVIGRRLKREHVLLAKLDQHLLLVSDLDQRGPFEWPFEDRHDFVRAVQTDNHADQQRGAAFDQHPAEVFEMFEKCLYGPAAVLLGLLWTRLFSGIGHDTCSLNSIRLWSRRKVERCFQRWNQTVAPSAVAAEAPPPRAQFHRSLRATPF